MKSNLTKLQDKVYREFNKTFWYVPKNTKQFRAMMSFDAVSLKKFISLKLEKAYNEGKKEVLRYVEYNAETRIFEIPEEKLKIINQKES